jgi:hypothetical protein
LGSFDNIEVEQTTRDSQPEPETGFRLRESLVIQKLGDRLIGESPKRYLA